MPRLSTQRSSVDNPGNARAHMATVAAIIPRVVSIRELIHASSAATCLQIGATLLDQYQHSREGHAGL